MRVIKGIVNAVLMATLIKPMVKLMIGRWRRQAQESPAAAIGIQVQELFEAALVEELAPAVTEVEAELEPESTTVEIIEAEASRSALRLLLFAGIAIAATAASAYGIRELIRRRREAQAADRELVAVPVESDAEESIEDVVLEALAEEG